MGPRSNHTLAALCAATALRASTAAAQSSNAPRDRATDPLQLSQLCFPRSAGGTGAGIHAVDYHRRRVEPAGFPVIAGSTDIGAYFGLAGTLSYFRDGCRPYFWNMNLALAASIKAGPAGVELVQQNYQWQMDIVGVLRGRLRLNPAVFVSRTINQAYYGLGNGDRPQLPDPYTGEPGRFNQYGSVDVWAFLSARYMIKRPFSLAMAVAYQYVGPHVYAGSLLDRESRMHAVDGSPLLHGVQPLHLVRTSLTAIIDTRDNEVMPRRGIGYGVWGQFARGFPLSADTVYGSVGASLAHYVPVAGPVIFASRVVADLQFGRVPFYDLFRGSVPYLTDMPGGANAIRGVPSGRYLGQIKVYANLELRALLYQFTVLSQSFTLGAAIFADLGRAFSDYTFASPLDGPAPGIKWGAGAGGYIRWGQAALFRVELAYSPDAAAVSPGFPFGFYIVDHVMF
jgi:hypothetical protein